MNNIKDIVSTYASKLKPLVRYKLLAFIIFVVALCGYEVLQINSASSVTASDSVGITGPAAPHLDQSVINQLQQLQDNSVGVKALFNQSRDNPFQ